MDGAIRQKTKFLIFSSDGTIRLSLVVLELRRENEITENKNWLLWVCLLRDRKSRFRSFIYSHGGTERWKPRENPSSGSWDNRADRNRLKTSSRLYNLTPCSTFCDELWLTSCLIIGRLYNRTAGYTVASCIRGFMTHIATTALRPSICMFVSQDVRTLDSWRNIPFPIVLYSG